MQRTAIIIPCYNEEKRLLLDNFKVFLEENAHINLFFVNDGSSDGTGKLLEEFCESSPRLSYLSLPVNLGKANAVREGVLMAINQKKYEVIGYWDADLATPLFEINRMLQVVKDKQLAVVFGARVKLLGKQIDRRLFRHYFGRVYATMVSLVLRLPIYDSQCGAKLFLNIPSFQEVFEKPFTVNWTFDVEIIARFLLIEDVFKGKPFNECILEMPLDVWKDIKGSKVGSFDFFVAITELLRIRKYLKQNGYYSRLKKP